MGGMRWGAGRPAWHVKAEHCKSLDVRRFQREGCLSIGAAGTWAWRDPDTGERLASIGYRSAHGSLHLDYSIDGMPRPQVITISRTPCHYGGTRPWFTCPVRGERVAKLYLRGGRFACRHCQRLVYASQSEDLCGRSWRRQAKVEARLEDNWGRPKGMHRSTYERLIETLMDCEEERERAIAAFLARHSPDVLSFLG